HRGDEAALHRTVSVGEFRLRAKTEMHRAVRIDRKKLAAEQLCDRGDQVEIGSAHLPLRSSTSVVPSAAGLGETRIPAERIASIFESAPPLPPEMIAPAWPIRRPGGAVTPAMTPTIGFLVLLCLMK